MKTITALGVIMMLAAGLVPAVAEDIVLFDAKTAGPDVWTWDGARIMGQPDGRLILTLDKGEHPAVFLEDRFAYNPDGVVEVAIGSVAAGTYAVQALAFQGNSYLGAADLLKDTNQAGTKTFKLGNLDLPAGTETITFKLWVSKQIGSSTVINNLRYFIPVPADKVLYDRRPDSTLLVTPDKVDWNLGDGGAVITLQGEQSYGSVLLPDFIAKPEAGTFVLQVANVNNGTVTAQACAFDATKQYLDSVDIIKSVTSDMSISMNKIAWPEGAALFQVKLWLGGSPDATATIRRVLVLR